MTAFAAARAVLTSFRTAWCFQWPFLVTHLCIRLLVLAIVAPLASLALSIGIAARGTSALTDQDIAYFFLSPAGLAAGLVVLSLLLAGAVLDVAVMTSILRGGQKTLGQVLGSAARFVASHAVPLLHFALQLIVRVSLIALPFLGLAALAAVLLLGQHDINYYLTYRPPAFLGAAITIAALVVALAVVLLARLSGWAIALHLVLFENQSPGKAFGESTRRLKGHKMQTVMTLLFWVIARGLLGLAVGAIAAAAFNLVPGLLGANLRGLAAAAIVLLLLWAFANAVVAALSNGALSDLLYRLYRLVSPEAQPATAAQPDGKLTGALVPLRALIAVAVAALAGGLIAGGALLENAAATRTVEIIAHRGASDSRPENTLAAIDQAVVERADWVEIDVQETADFEVVVAHDSDFMKLAGVDLKIWDATMADLAGIDIGSWFDPAYANERTPTLREALQTVKGSGKLLIELKYYGHDVELEQRVVAIVEEEDMADDIAVMSLKIDGVRKMQELRPDWRYGILAARAIGNLASLDADFLAVNTGQVSLGLIRRAHAGGKQLYVWTVDDPVTMSRMISLGADGLITNKPVLARQVMDARNALTTPERLALWLTDRFQVGSFDLVADEKGA